MEKIASKVSGEIILNSDVVRVRRHAVGATLIHKDGKLSHYDKVVMAMHAPQALEMIEDANVQEKEILSAFGYKENEALLHNDKNALYPDKGIYAAWNYKTGGKANAVTLSYWINKLQNLKSDKEYFVSLNETAEIKDVIEKISYEHPQFDGEAIKMQSRRDEINGKNHTYYAGAYWRNGFHEDGLWSANTIAQSMECAL